MKKISQILILLIPFLFILCKGKKSQNQAEIDKANIQIDKVQKARLFEKSFCEESVKDVIELRIQGFKSKFPKELLYNEGFSIELRNYEKLLSDLSIDGKIALPEHNVYGIRFYPAVNPVDNSLFIVLIGEKIDTTQLLDKRYTTLLDSSYCVLASNYKPYYIADTKDKKMFIDAQIKEFRTTYYDKKIVSASSYVGYVSSFIKMFKDLFPKGDDVVKKTFFGLNILPGYYNNSLSFFGLPQEIVEDGSGNTTRTILDKLCYYDEMNECPNHCPTNEIK